MNHQELIERLRQYNGIVECRVQHPQTGCYCVSFDWHNSFNPKRNADEWLADHKKRFPDHEYSTTYVVKEVRVPSQQDEACQEAADAIESLLNALDVAEGEVKRTVAERDAALAELAKYRDAPVVAYATTNEEDDLTMLFFDEDEARKYSGDDDPIKLIVKPGEEK